VFFLPAPAGSISTHKRVPYVRIRLPFTRKIPFPALLTITGRGTPLSGKSPFSVDYPFFFAFALSAPIRGAFFFFVPSDHDTPVDPFLPEPTLLVKPLAESLSPPLLFCNVSSFRIFDKAAIPYMHLCPHSLIPDDFLRRMKL